MSKEIVSAEVHFTPQSNNIIDRRLIRAAASGHRSGNALAEAVNFLYSPEWCLNRLLEILDENDILSEANDRRLLVLNVRDITESVRQDYENARGMKGNAANAKVLLDALKLIDNITNGPQIDVDAIQVKISTGMAKIMADSIEAAQHIAAKELSERYAIPMEEVDGVFMEALPLGVREIEKHVGE